MSYQGQSWAWKVRGIKRGERAVLDFIAWRQDQRTNVAKASNAEIAEHCEMVERQVTRILKQLGIKGLVVRILGGDGRGRVPLYSLVGFEQAKKGDISKLLKGDISSSERVTFPTLKGDISDPLIRKEETSLRNTEGNTNPPNPLFSKGGTLTAKQISRLRRRMLALEKDWNRRAEARVGTGSSWTFEQLINVACDQELIPFADAYPYVTELWQENHNTRLRKAPQSA